MLNNFQKYINDNRLFDPSKVQLLAVSGGVDSMVLLELMRLSTFKFAVAHCNFNLRSVESDADEKLVKKYCDKYAIQLFVKSFKTKKFASNEKISIQMAARQLRYEWFDEIIVANHLQKILTAHHLDDQVETFFINLIRGSGLNGLSGMPTSTEKLARPLIHFKKEELYVFAKENQVPFREDVSNEDDKYLRNKIRLNFIPQFQELNPNFTESLQESMSYISEAKNLLADAVDEFIQSAVIEKKNQKIIDYTKLKNCPAPQLILFELLRPFGFNTDQINSILNTNKSKSGAKFYSEAHILLVNRDEIILEEKIQNIDDEVIEIDQFEFENESLKGKIFPKSDLKMFPNGKSQAVFDADKIKLPLEISNWKNGDSFQPFGMKGFKKLSDFFIDEKLSLFEKEKVKVLKSQDHIIWVLGYRIDNRYRVDENTKYIWQIELK